MITKGLLPLALAAIVAGASSAQAQTETAERSGLRLQNKEGDEQRYAFSWDFKQKQSMGGGMDLGEINVAVTYVFDQTVKSVKDGVASIEATVDSIKAGGDAKMMGMPMPKETYDSETGEGSDALRALQTVVGKTFTYKLSPTGAVTDLEGGDEIRDALVAAGEEEMAKLQEKMGAGGMGGGGMGGMGMPGGMGAVFVGQLAIAFSNEALQSTLDVMNNMLPAEPKGEGDTWTRDVVETLPQLGELRAKAKYKHDGTMNGVTRISFRPEGEVKLETKKGQGGDNQYADMERQLLGKQEVTKTSMQGVATFDGKHLLDSEVIQEIQTEGELPQMLKMQMGPEAKDMKLSMGHRLTLRYEKVDAKKADAKKETGSRF